MPRPKKTVPNIQKNIGLPKDLLDRLDIILFSEVEGRVPFGAYSEFFTNLLREYFENANRRNSDVSSEI